jgi:hypothetical protein
MLKQILHYGNKDPGLFFFWWMLLLILRSIIKKFSLIDWLCTVSGPSQEIVTHMETSPLLVKSCKPLSRERFFILLHLLWQRVSFSFSCLYLISSERTAPISCLLRHARGYGGPNKYFIPYFHTGLHSVTSYDTVEDAEDLLLPGSSGSKISFCWVFVLFAIVCVFWSVVTL